MKKVVFILGFAFLFFGVNYGNATTEKFDDGLVYTCDNLAAAHYQFVLDTGGSQSEANTIFMVMYDGCCSASSNPGADCSTAAVF